MRKTRFFTLCFLLVIAGSCSKSGRPAYSPPGGEFSFVPPEHWMMREMPGFKYQFAFGPTINAFSPNINFVDQTMPSTLEEYVESNLQVLQQMATKEKRDLKIITQGEFRTDFNRSGVRLVTETTYESNPVRQTFYFFEGKDDLKFVITCTAPADQSQAYDKICNSSIRTFKPKD